jgi:recombination protein RecR
MLTEQTLCSLCTNERRDRSQLCVVEMPADVIAIEQSAAFQGLYFVLMGHLSPLDGVGPGDLGIELLERRFKEGGINEVVLATSVTVEGDATAHLIASLASRHRIKASRIAYGVPMGGELEFIDSGTLSRALSGRREIEAAAAEDGW